ncbi:exodeoxyribonuclease III [Allosaccharopolyspora coralli]|uniref:Exodeoxyribonuclease III n=1 Tax=Allosaccharopolyspora coralli TaxID=2665642 RepID=A0A5Q3Q9N3_9PSEU|nr:exodeoxyribonuclease III [Allosaccharopolyspora coralli]QGK71401.1 exodeoxyribonuclease III [Allosaccharopolyspora coralli]
MLTVSTVNVNGLRAASKKGYLEWLSATAADVVCLQETRAEPDQLPPAVREPEGWHLLLAPSATKGRSGVAVLSRTEPSASRIGFGSEEFDDSGRYAEVELPGLVVASLYLPSGDVGTERQDEKERFMAEFLPYLAALRERAEAEGKDVAVCGDWNIAHREIDLKNWKANQKSAGFLPEEREWMSRVFDELGYVDVFRQQNPDGPGPYSWWSYRGKAFDNDSGWRIDYQAVTSGLAERAVDAVVERAPSYDKRWSDHAPVTVTFDRS